MNYRGVNAGMDHQMPQDVRFRIIEASTPESPRYGKAGFLNEDDSSSLSTPHAQCITAIDAIVSAMQRLKSNHRAT